MDPLDLLRLVAWERSSQLLAEWIALDLARQAGHSWRVIGDALGVTRSAAQQRHASLSERLMREPGSAEPVEGS